jgi:beta-glucanase (GH16 family)
MKHTLQHMKNFFLTLFLCQLTLFTACSSDDTKLIENNSLPNPEGYTLVWNDEFNGTEIDTDKWNYELGDGTDYGLKPGWGNNEKQLYTNAPENSFITQDGTTSALAITALKDGDGFTSAKVTTQNTFTTRFGRVSVRAKIPKGQGMWPAIWMLGANKTEIDWPGCGEIDIMEILGHETDKLLTTLHYTGEDNKYEIIENTHVLSTGDFSESYHEYTLDWTPEKLSFSLDSNPLYEVAIASDMKEYLRDFYLILNVAVGGNLSGEVDETTSFPQAMLVDYVRVYSQDDLDIPEVPALDVEEETVGQVIDESLASNAIQSGFTSLGDLKAASWGPGAPFITSSETSIEGDQSLSFSYPGGEWGGSFLQLDTPKSVLNYNSLVFSLHKPTTLVDGEIKLENPDNTGAAVFLKDYTPTPVNNGFVEYNIPLSAFEGLDLENISIPFSIWNPKDSEENYFEGEILIDNLYFSN